VVHEETGLLVPMSNSTAFAMAIRRLAESPNERMMMGCAGQRRLQERFSEARMAQETAVVYQQVLQVASQKH
jgi:glycosyltransferase involved in cell wall biosynthesis